MKRIPNKERSSSQYSDLTCELSSFTLRNKAKTRFLNAADFSPQHRRKDIKNKNSKDNYS